MKMRSIILVAAMSSLVGCSTLQHRDPIEAKQALNEAINEHNSHSLDQLPDSVQSDLLPSDTNSALVSQDMQKRFRVKANNVRARAFFTSLVKNSGYSIALDPKVSGRVTLNLTNVTLDEVLNVMRETYGYQIEKKGKLIFVYPADIQTVTIPVDYLQLKRSGRSLTTITSGSITSSDNSSSSSDSSSSSTSPTGGTEIETLSESDFWPQLETAVSQLIGSGKGQSVVVSPQASMITVRAYPQQIRQIRQFLNVSQKRLHRQVVLEAKILEVTLSDHNQQGIEWSNLSKSIGSGGISFGSTGIPSPGNAMTNLIGGNSTLKITDGNFSAVLQFMQTQGDLNVLSSPRVTATNNQKAVIKVGTDEYFVTNYSSVVGTGDNSNPAPDFDLTPFFSGISLDITPQIDDQGNVLMHVHPAVISVEESKRTITTGKDQAIELPLAKSTIRESDSVVRAKDGDVIVIGGLMKTSNIKQISKIPVLGDIPVLGHLFSNTDEVQQKTELVILLKPTVVTTETWQNELKRSRDLLQDWFPDKK